MTLTKLREREEGFTLIELLVVIIIIGILAAIAIPTFLNQREKGWESAAKSALRNAAIAQESFFTDANPNTYAADVADLEVEGFNHDPLVILLEIDDADADSYCMDAAHASGGDRYVIDSAGGEVTEGECP